MGDCPICFETFKRDSDGADVVFCRACGHNAHEECMERWRQANGGDCPLCRCPWPVSPDAPINLSRITCEPRQSLEALYPETHQFIRRYPLQESASNSHQIQRRDSSQRE